MEQDNPKPQSLLYQMVAGKDAVSDLKKIPGGTAILGTDDPVIDSDGEAPLRKHPIASFLMSANTVTNAEFERFTNATGHVTEAERLGRSMVFQSQVANDAEDQGSVFGTEWWHVVEGANWRYPGGGTTPAKPERPVVHVSWRDALAFCAWAGGKLPSEAQWEHAARGSLGDVRYPWGDENPDGIRPRPCNIWQGPFPAYEGPEPGPVSSENFAPNEFGLHHMCGNVWEWTQDVFGNAIGKSPGRRVMKGGSFLCHESYCFRYRIAARIGVVEASTTSHQGFRIVFDTARSR